MPAALSNTTLFPPSKLPVPPGFSPVSFPYAIPPGNYFVLGDNWSNSLDSRYYGAVPLTNIIGRLVNK